MLRIRRYLAPLVVLASLHACTEPGPDVSPATVVVAVAGLKTIASGQAIALTAVIKNSAGVLLTDQAVSWSSSDPTIVSMVGGLATGVHVGDAQVTATVGTLKSASVTITVTPGAATQLFVRTQPAGGASGSPLATQPVVEIRDAAGNLVTSSAATVTATINQGGGTLTGSTASAVGGVATFTNLAVTGSVGDRTLSFSVADIAPVTSSGFAVNAGPLAQLVIRTQPNGAAAGVPMGIAAVVELRDALGNLATTSTTPITAAIAIGGGALTNATVTPVGGIATFTDLTLSGLVGTRTLIFSAPGVSPAVSAAFTVAPGPAKALRIRTQPRSTSNTGALATQPVIEVIDAGGNLATTSAVVVTAAVATGDATVVGGSTATSVNGVATFTALAVTGAPGTVTISFSAGGLTPVTSAQFALVPGPPTEIRILTQPGNGGFGQPLSPQPSVALYDAGGNLATNYSGVISASIASGTGSVSNGVAPVVNGTATFSALAVSGPAGTITLSLAAGGLSVTTSSFTITGSPPTRLVVRTAPPSSAGNGVPMSPVPVVEVQDAFGNVVPVAITVAFTTDASSGTITNGTVTSVNGVATFSNLTLSGPLGFRNYQFVAASLSSSGVYRIEIVP